MTFTQTTTNQPFLTHFLKLIPIVFAKQRMSQRLPPRDVCVQVCVCELRIRFSEERVSVDYYGPKVLCPFINLAS